MKKIATICYAVTLLCGALFLASCSSPSSNSTPGSATITGTVFAAPVSSATVTVLNADGVAVATTVTSTDGTGAYSLDLLDSDLSGTLSFESAGGTFVDETTGETTTAGHLSAYVPAGSLTTGSSVNIDTISTIVSELVTSHGKTVDEAKTAVSAAFGYVADFSVAPVLSSGVYSGSTGTRRLTGLLSEVISQITYTTLKLAPEKQFDLLPVIAADLADNGKLDGLTLNGITLPADILTKTLKMLQTVSSKALTPSYKITYGYPMGTMGAQQGKTRFTLKITDHSDVPVTGLSLSLMPMMHMPTKMHGTPMEPVITEGPAGTYTCTGYYIMSTVMSSKAAGYWELQAKIGGMDGESAYFYPYVDMMGSYGQLSGTNDLISSGTGTATRTYYLFNDGLITDPTLTTMTLFIAAKESMSSYPAIASGNTVTLHDGNGDPWTISSVLVTASIDNWATSYTAVEGAVSGHWTIPTDIGLVSGTTNTILVSLTVDGELKTNGTATYATFTVTP